MSATKNKSLRTTIRTRQLASQRDDPTKLRSQGSPEIAALHNRLGKARMEANRVKMDHAAETKKRRELELIVKAHKAGFSPRPDMKTPMSVEGREMISPGKGMNSSASYSPFAMPTLRLQSSPNATHRLEPGDHGHTAQLAFSKLQAEEVAHEATKLQLRLHYDAHVDLQKKHTEEQAALLRTQHLLERTKNEHEVCIFFRCII
jgi:hypothetical protein|tara:strand:+ start:102 stop:713 length:612 start_codon:yes stop_codon:yes gene_type:complete